MKNKLLKLHFDILKRGEMYHYGLCHEIGWYISYGPVAKLFSTTMQPRRTKRIFWGAPNDHNKWDHVYTDLRQNLLILFAYAYKDLIE